MAWFRKAAAHGSAEAECALGGCYALGVWVPKDPSQAINLYRKAADQGNAKGQYFLGVMYVQGEGAAEDMGEAIKWFRLSADQGNVDAEHALAMIFERGVGTPLNYAEGLKWLQKSACAGHFLSRVLLSTVYSTGHGVHIDLPEAYKWANIAVGQIRPVDWIECEGIAASGSAFPLVTVTHVMIDVGETRLVKTPSGNMRVKCLGTKLNTAQILVEGESESRLILPESQRNNTPLYRKTISYRNSLEKLLTAEQVAEGQRRSSAFIATNKMTAYAQDYSLPAPEFELPALDDADSSPGQYSSEDDLQPWAHHDAEATGTGFFVTDDGYFITCEHVINGSTSFHIKTKDGSATARLVKVDPTNDLALLKVAGTFHAVPVAGTSEIKLGDNVFTVGFPNQAVQGTEPKLTSGEISSLSGMRDNPRYFQISVPVQPGNSGGALMDNRGNVVGVVAARLSEAAAYKTSGALPQNVNYAIKSHLLYDFLYQMPEMRGKLKRTVSTNDSATARSAAEHASVLVFAE
jgi:S1-C subfamily serine protease